MGAGTGIPDRGDGTDKGQEARQRLLGTELLSCWSHSRGDCTVPHPHHPRWGFLGEHRGLAPPASLPRALSRSLVLAALLLGVGGCHSTPSLF